MPFPNPVTASFISYYSSPSAYTSDFTVWITIQNWAGSQIKIIPSFPSKAPYKAVIASVVMRIFLYFNFFSNAFFKSDLSLTSLAPAAPIPKAAQFLKFKSEDFNADKIYSEITLVYKKGSGYWKMNPFK